MNKTVFYSNIFVRPMDNRVEMAVIEILATHAINLSLKYVFRPPILFTFSQGRAPGVQCFPTNYNHCTAL